MLLTISKRFEFSASRRVAVSAWDDQRNRATFGPAALAPHGTGRNYTATFVFRGPVDPRTGMIINVTAIKALVKDLLASRYDHKFLNRDTPPFDDLVPTCERVAARLLADAAPLFADHAAEPVACHLVEDDRREATAYRDGTVESHHWLDWSAARCTRSPHLSDDENARLFGLAAGLHGHHYRLRVTLVGPADLETGLPSSPAAVVSALDALFADLDHRYLNDQVPALADRPLTTESLVRWLHARLAADLPVRQVRLYERDDFFAEHHATGGTRLGLLRTFDAAHRLHSPMLDDAANVDTYERCNNPAGHGHTYRVEATVAAPYDERSGTCGDFLALGAGMEQALAPWQDRHLDLETDDFRDRPSTSENIIQVLWPRLEAAVGGALARLRLWETPNNRFALRRDGDGGPLEGG